MGRVRDLLTIVPSRGRPDRLAVMLEAVYGLSEADTDVAVCLDLDDPQLPVYEAVLSALPVIRLTGRRDTLSGWTNRAAALHAGEYRAVASLGDDHVPRTPSWDGLLLDALDNMNDAGTGIAYGDDTIMGQRLPTAPVITADIVHALGWVCEPSLRHMYVDNVWADLGRAAGCLAYVPEVVIEHVHWSAGRTPLDAVYAESEAGKEADRVAYEAWLAVRADADAAIIRALKEKAA